MPSREFHDRSFDERAFPLVVAHRGASATHPENTLAAFDAAIAAGADAVELDARLTADEVVVVLHDSDVGRVTGGAGPVSSLTLADVKRLRVGGEEIATLAETLRLLSGRAGVDVEIKNFPGEPSFDSPREAVAEAVLRALEEEAFAGPVIVTSFNWLSIERVRELAPNLPTGFITVAPIEPAAALVYARTHGHEWILPQADALVAAGPGIVEEAHGSALRVGTWTVDDEDRLAELFAWGVDAVASNDPALAVRVRDRVRAAR